MKTRDQRRQRRPLGSVFVGQAPQKRSLAGAASSLLPNMVAPLLRKACRMDSKYTCQIWQKIWQKSAKKTLKIDRESSKRHQIWPVRLLFRRFDPSWSM